MAQLGTYYGLCPLIEQENLLGVNEDIEIGKVIVTLGKNIAIKYQISDQKQIHSWRTRDKFSSPVIFNKETQKYVAVFNQSYMRVWDSEIEYLDKLKKYKFNRTIYTLINCDLHSYVIFTNGNVIELNYAIENRKELVLEDVITSDSDLSIVTANLNDKVYIGLLSKTEDKTLFICNILGENKKEVVKFELKRDSHHKLSGLMLTSLENTGNIHLLSLWSDGKLFSCPIITEEENEVNLVQPPGEMFALVESLSCKLPVRMTSLNNNYIALYGADSKEDGASVILYNIQFKVSQSKQQLKLYTPQAKLWKIQNNLLLSVGQHLAVIPFHLDTEKLASLVGSRRKSMVDLDPDVTIVEDLKVVSWDNNMEVELKLKVSARIKNKVMSLARQGLPEALICDELLPKFIEKNDFQSIEDCINSFCDIPEIYLAKLLKLFLTVDRSAFKKSQNYCTYLPLELQPLERCIYIDKILILPFSDVLLVPHVKNELNLNCTILLLQYICYLMSEEGHLLPLNNSTQSEKKLIDWGCLLVDANYQNFLFSKDPKIIETLQNYKKLVNDYLNSMKVLHEVLPIINHVKNGKTLSNQQHKRSEHYNIVNEKLF